MTDYTTHTQERIAREHYHDACFVGIDGDGGAHYWSIYHQTVLVLNGESVAYDLALPVEADDGTPIRTLGEWHSYVFDRAGWAHHRVSESLVADLQRSVRA